MPPLVTSYILRAPPPSELPSPLPERERDVLVAPGLPMKDAALSQQCSNKHISESPIPKMLVLGWLGVGVGRTVTKPFFPTR